MCFRFCLIWLHLDILLRLCYHIVLWYNSDFFFYQGFLSLTLTTHRTAGKGLDHFLFHSTTFIRSRTFRHLFATLHVRWLSHIFNRTALFLITPYRITIIFIDDVKLIFCFFTWWLDSSFLLQQFYTGNRWSWTCIEQVNRLIIIVN